MRKILIIFAHLVLEKSRVHKRLLHYIPQQAGIRLNDLYENYPDFDIDVKREQERNAGFPAGEPAAINS